MNIKKGFSRLAVLLTIIAGAYGYKSGLEWNNINYEVEEVALHQKNNVCSNLTILTYSETKTNKKIYYLSRDGLEPKSNFFDRFNYSDSCNVLLNLATSQNLKTPLLVSKITDDEIRSYAENYKRGGFIVFFKEQFFAVFKAITYLWLALLSLLISYQLINWVFKGFKSKN